MKQAGADGGQHTHTQDLVFTASKHDGKDDSLVALEAFDGSSDGARTKLGNVSPTSRVLLVGENRTLKRVEVLIRQR